MSQQQRDDENYGDDDLYEEEETQFTDFYLSFQSTVVGIQYYDGLGTSCLLRLLIVTYRWLSWSWRASEPCSGTT